MKKTVSVILSVILVVSCLIPASAYKDGNVNAYPVVLVPGYSSGQLEMTDENGNVSRVWGLDFGRVGQMVLEEAATLVAGLGGITVGNYSIVADTVGERFIELTEGIKCNPDGTSKYDISVILPNTAEGNRWSNLSEDLKTETNIIGELTQYISEEDIYNFHCDFRFGAAECAAALDRLITDIVTTTGCEKVNILAISHGGQVTGAYLSMFGDKQHVNNCVMFMPAMGGAALAYDIVTNNVHLDEKTLLRFIEFGTRQETDFHWLVEAEKLGFLDNLLAEFVPYVLEFLGYWGSIWDFIPLDYFDETIKLLDAEDSALLIEKTTWFHNNIMANYAENLKKAQDAGANISVITGSGIGAVTGLQENSDGIIRTEDTCGALCAPFGNRFADGYRTIDTVCSNKSHNHLSPSMEIDASCCWLPENTWFVDGLFHGMEYWDNYTRELMYTQLIGSQSMTSVHDNADFPQFHAHTNSSDAVYAEFDMSAQGYVSGADSSIVITNTSAANTVDVYGIEVKGLDIEFEKFDVKTIKPGQSIKISFTGNIPDVSLVRAAVTVYWISYGSITPVGSRTFDFTVMNGDAVPYDRANPFVDADFTADYRFVTEEMASSPFAELVDMLNRLILKFAKIMCEIFKIFI